MGFYDFHIFPLPKMIFCVKKPTCIPQSNIQNCTFAMINNQTCLVESSWVWYKFLPMLGNLHVPVSAKIIVNQMDICKHQGVRLIWHLTKWGHCIWKWVWKSGKAPIGACQGAVQVDHLPTEAHRILPGDGRQKDSTIHYIFVHLSSIGSPISIHHFNGVLKTEKKYVQNKQTSNWSKMLSFPKKLRPCVTLFSFFVQVLLTSLDFDTIRIIFNLPFLSRIQTADSFRVGPRIVGFGWKATIGLHEPLGTSNYLKATVQIWTGLHIPCSLE